MNLKFDETLLHRKFLKLSNIHLLGMIIEICATKTFLIETHYEIMIIHYDYDNCVTSPLQQLQKKRIALIERDNLDSGK